MIYTAPRTWIFGLSARARHNLNVWFLLERRRHRHAASILAHQGDHPIQSSRLFVVVCEVIAMKDETMKSDVSTLLRLQAIRQEGRVTEKCLRE